MSISDVLVFDARLTQVLDNFWGGRPLLSCAEKKSVSSKDRFMPSEEIISLPN